MFMLCAMKVLLVPVEQSLEKYKYALKKMVGVERRGLSLRKIFSSADALDLLCPQKGCQFAAIHRQRVRCSGQSQPS